jgi:pimeloyl-ACP methyl ester carboxylesterase
MENLRVYGLKPFRVAVLHGGPGAPGEMAPVARELASITGVLEPLQTATSLEGQVRELHSVLKERGDPPATLIGWSWGAWLGYIFTARYSPFVRKLLLIGAPPYEESYAAGILPTRLSRLSEAERLEVFSLVEALNDPATDKNALMARFGGLMDRADSFDPLPQKNELLAYQYDINIRVWPQADEMRRSGRLLEMGKKIRCPVVAIHGDYDPHPAEGVKKPLSLVLRDFKFILLSNCGHHPWIEREAKERFYEVLKEEI